MTYVQKGAAKKPEGEGKRASERANERCLNSGWAQNESLTVIWQLCGNNNNFNSSSKTDWTTWQSLRKCRASVWVVKQEKRPWVDYVNYKLAITLKLREGNVADRVSVRSVAAAATAGEQ